MGFTSSKWNRFPPPCVLKTRPVTDKTHSYLSQSVEMGMKSEAAMSIAKEFSNNKLKGFSLRSNEATSPAAECPPSEVLKVQFVCPVRRYRAQPRSP